MRFWGLCLALLAQQPLVLHAFADAPPPNIQQELGPLLSRGAVIVTPNSPDWAALQLRSASPRVQPNYFVVVQVATEGDVQTTIQYANRKNVPFLAVSGAHAWTKDLNKVLNGIQINLRKLNSTSLSQDGKTATIGGGALQDEVTKGLAQHNRMAVTGLCSCTSLIGPLMGSGHSALQGQFGFAADNLVSARVVVANGSCVDVSSTSNPDLFWAMRGAGHNFGIVTKYTVSVYPTLQSGWTVLNFIYTADKLEAVFNAINQVTGPSGNQDPKLVLLGNFLRLPDVDPKNPIILWTVLYEGSITNANALVTPLYHVGPFVASNSTSVPYGELYDTIGLGLTSPVCIENQNYGGYATSFTTWNATAMRTAFNVFTTLTADSRFNTSAVIFENYGLRGVHAADATLTSLPAEERDLAVFTSSTLAWEGEDPATKATALNYGLQIRDAIEAGRPVGTGVRHVYVNFAAGGESEAETYGRDPARRQRLKNLKKAWDPQERFGFLARIDV